MFYMCTEKAVVAYMLLMDAEGFLKALWILMIWSVVLFCHTNAGQYHF